MPSVSTGCTHINRAVQRVRGNGAVAQGIHCKLVLEDSVMGRWEHSIKVFHVSKPLAFSAYRYHASCEFN